VHVTVDARQVGAIFHCPTVTVRGKRNNLCTLGKLACWRNQKSRLFYVFFRVLPCQCCGYSMLYSSRLSRSFVISDNWMAVVMFSSDVSACKCACVFVVTRVTSNQQQTIQTLLVTQGVRLVLNAVTSLARSLTLINSSAHALTNEAKWKAAACGRAVAY